MPAVKEESPFQHIRHHKKRLFLEAYSLLGTVKGAAEAVEQNRCTHYHWLQHDATFAAAFAGAEEQAGDELEAVAWERATKGWTEVEVEYGPKDEEGNRPEHKVKRTTKHSNTMLIFLLKGFKPGKYRDRYSVEGAAGGEAFIKLVAELVAKHLKGAELRRFESDLGRLTSGSGNGNGNGNGNGKKVGVRRM